MNDKYNHVLGTICEAHLCAGNWWSSKFSVIIYVFDDLVVTAPSKEDLQRKVKAWRDCLMRKGLKVNEGKTKIMKGGSSTGVTSESGAHPCGVCRAGVTANSILCTGCGK